MVFKPLPNSFLKPMRACAMLYAVCLFALITANSRYHFLERMDHPKIAPFPEAVPRFTSNQPDQAVTVPFTSYRGGIIVLADFNGTSISCLVDSGARDIVTNLDLHCKRVGHPITYPIPTGVYAPAEFVEAPQIKIGGYALLGAPIVSLAANGAFPAYPGGIGQNGLLGNYAFKKTVLTIDYARQLLTIHPASYDITRQPRHAQDALIDLTFHGDNPNFPELFSAQGSIEGQAVYFTIDTGNSSDGLLISPALRQRLNRVGPGTFPRSSYYMFGQAVNEETRPLHWTLGDASGQTPGLTIAMRSDVDCLLGYQALKNFRVTIDYPRKKLLLEPNER